MVNWLISYFGSHIITILLILQSLILNKKSRNDLVVVAFFKHKETKETKVYGVAHGFLTYKAFLNTKEQRKQRCTV